MSAPGPRVRCRRGGRTARLRRNHTLGEHNAIEGTRPLRCTAGGTRHAGPPQPQPGQRLTVTVDLVAPAGARVTTVERAVDAVIRAHLGDDLLVVSTAVERADDDTARAS